MAEAKSHVETIDLIALETGSELAVASTGVAYSKSIPWPHGSSFSIEYQFDSAAAVDVKVEIESGAARPTTENVSDAAWAVGNTISSGITDEATHFSVPAPTVSPFCRLKLTGQGANAASTKLTKLKLHWIPAF